MCRLSNVPERAEMSAIPEIPTEIPFNRTTLTALAKDIHFSFYSLYNKEVLAKHLVDKKPSFYVEATLDNLRNCLFIGFKLAEGVKPADFLSPHGGLVVPRAEPIDDEKAYKCVLGMYKIRHAAQALEVFPTFLVKYSTPLYTDVYKIMWYSYFEGLVSLESCSNPGAYKVISRKEMLNVEPEHR